MSGIYIPGMKMPTRCWNCPMCYDMMACTLTGLNWYRDTVDLSIDPVEERMPNCPLIEIPPHGRMIDADKLERMFADIDNAPYSGFDGEDPFYSADDAVQIIRLAPTIIPAEGGIDNG